MFYGFKGQDERVTPHGTRPYYNDTPTLDFSLESHRIAYNIIGQRIRRSMSTNPPTVEEMKAFVIQALNLEGMTPDMIADEAPLIGKGLGLDSVDALELVVAMEKEFAVRIASNEIDPKAFSSVASLTHFLRSRMSGKAGA